MPSYIHGHEDTQHLLSHWTSSSTTSLCAVLSTIFTDLTVTSEALISEIRGQQVTIQNRAMVQSLPILPLPLQRPGVLQHRCNYCKVSSPKLFYCAGCGIARYCSQAHQNADSPEHKTVCAKISESRVKVAAGKHQVQNLNTVFSALPIVSGNQADHYSGFEIYQDHVAERSDFVDLLWKTGTLGGIEEALYHSLDMHRLGFYDHRNLHRNIPMLMLEVNDDQGCYDFVCRYLEVLPMNGGRRVSEYSSSEDMKNADIMQAVKFTSCKDPDIFHIAAILLILIKLLVDMHNMNTLRRVCTKYGKLPIELVTMMEAALVVSPLSEVWRERSREILLQEFHQRMSTLEAHIRRLGTFIDHKAPCLWNLILELDYNIERTVRKASVLFSTFTTAHARELLHHTYFAWYQVEGAIPAMRRALDLSQDKDMATMWSNFGRALAV